VRKKELPVMVLLSRINLEYKLIWNTFEAEHFTITKISWLMLFSEIIVLYAENHMKPINTLCGENVELVNVKAGGKYSNHLALKG
jgi:hypothetical protein